MLLPDPKLVEVSIRHIIPDEQTIDDALIRRTTQYYNQSLKVMGKLPTIEEQERLHVCAYIAVENLKSRLSIKSKVSLNQIALPSKKSRKIMDEIHKAIIKSSNAGLIKRYKAEERSPHTSKTEKRSTIEAEKIQESPTSTPKTTPMKVKKIVLSINGKKPSSSSKQSTEKQKNNRDQYISSSDDESISDTENEVDINNNDNDYEAREFKEQILSHASASSSTPLTSTEYQKNKMLNAFTKSPKKKSGRSLIDKLVAASSTENSMISNNSTFIEKASSPKKRKRLSTSTLVSDTNSASPGSSQILSSPEVSSDSLTTHGHPKSFSSPFRVTSRSGSAKKHKKSIFNGGDIRIRLSPPTAEQSGSDYDSDGVSVISRSKRAKHSHSPLKSSPLKLEQRLQNITDDQENNNKKSPTTKDIVHVCNILKIPKESMIRIILEYRSFEKRIKEKWGLICGLIVAIYTYIFRKFFAESKITNPSNFNIKINLKQKLYNEIWKWQRGDLTQKDIQKWHSFAIEMLGTDKLKEFYDLNNRNEKLITDPENTDIQLNDFENYPSSSGRMVDPKLDFSNAYYRVRYARWAKSINKKIHDMA